MSSPDRSTPTLAAQISFQNQPAFSAPEPPGADQTSFPPKPQAGGLRSPMGLRWLQVVGASVVAVSVVRLVAAEWSRFAPGLQFLLLVTGALGLFAAGEILHRRLHLPVAGSALLTLFAVLSPLLAWGAGRQHLLSTPSGTLAAGVGLAALIALVPRLLRLTLDLRSKLLATAFGIFLAAIPVLPELQTRLHGSPRSAIQAERWELTFCAILLGLLYRTALCHLNRELFHRDRLAARPVKHFQLPFLALTLLYFLACASLSTFTFQMALPLALVAASCIDVGDEYRRAVARALGEQPALWPRRSRALLAMGVAGLALAFPLALLDLDGFTAAWVAILATVQALRWALAQRSSTAYGLALGTGCLAYHLVPTLVPEAVHLLYRSLLVNLGWASTGAAVGLADLGLLAALVVSGAWLRRRLTTPMRSLHGLAIAGIALFALAVAATEPTSVLVLSLPVACLLLLALRSLATPAPLVALWGTVWIFCRYLGLEESVFAPEVVQRLALVTVSGFGLVLWAQRRGLFPAEPARDWTLAARTPPLAMGALLLAPALVQPFWTSLVASCAAVGTLLLSRIDCTRPNGAETSRRAFEPLWSAALVWTIFLLLPRLVFGGVARWHGSIATAALLTLTLAVALRALESLASKDRQTAQLALAGALFHGFLAGAIGLLPVSSGPWLSAPWLALLPTFLASAFFALLALDRRWPVISTLLSASFFAAGCTSAVVRVGSLDPAVLCLGPGGALLLVATLLQQRLGELWSQRLFTGGAICLYAMPVLGMLGEIRWQWQILLLLFAVAFGALAFQVRSRSLLLASTAALLIDLTFFLVELRRSTPFLLWILGIGFGLTLMGLAALLEHRREILEQHLRIWGRQLRQWE